MSETTAPELEQRFFRDYEQQVLCEPVKGQPVTEWVVGVGADGDLLRFDWRHGLPHLLIAGYAGAGKSVLVDSMVCQLLHNNHPDDLNVWIADGGSAWDCLRSYRDAPHVTRFLDPREGRRPGLAAMLGEAVAEIHERSETFEAHPAQPQTLAEAHEIARQDPETSGHLNFPRTIIVIDECYVYFSSFSPPTKQVAIAYDALLDHAAVIATEARSTGIHLCVTSFEARSESVPFVLRQQCRRIGLATPSAVHSLGIIGETGLEEIRAKGQGKMATEEGCIDFRGLWLECNDRTGVDDRAGLLRRIAVAGDAA